MNFLKVQNFRESFQPLLKFPWAVSLRRDLPQCPVKKASKSSKNFVTVRYWLHFQPNLSQPGPTSANIWTNLRKKIILMVNQNIKSQLKNRNFNYCALGSIENAELIPESNLQSDWWLPLDKKTVKHQFSSL